MTFQRTHLRSPRRSRKRFADPRKVKDMRDLAARLGVETPRAFWARDVDDPIRRLERNLTHRYQPSLFGDQVEIPRSKAAA